MRLSVSLLGPFQATLGDQTAAFATDRARALLAYLAVEADRPHRREALAALLWPDRPETAARRNLSQTLARLRRAVDDHHANPPFLRITAKTIQFNTGSAELDVARFEALLATCAAHAHPGSSSDMTTAPDSGSNGDVACCLACIDRLEQAADLYRGGFMHGLFLPDGQLFEEWALFKREQLHRQALDVLRALTAFYEAEGTYNRARHYAQRQLSLEPWREEAHRQLMRALALGGQRGAALAQYETCCRLLAEELGAEPHADTTALYQRIQRGELRPANGPIPLPSLLARREAARDNLPPQTTPFVGREAELAELARWLADPEVRLVTILGPGGMGKTRLAVEAARLQLEAFPHGVVFLSMAAVDPATLAASESPLVAPLVEALGLTGHGNEIELDQLLAYLRDREMLLVLDGFEHLVETAGVVSQLLGQAPRLKVLVTSRQRLGLQEEWLLSLAGMRVPEGTETTTPKGSLPKPSEALATYDGLQLFWQHARRAQPNLDLAAAWAWAIRICQLVDGMPLGIELAAAWTRLMPLRAIVREIEANRDFLATTLRNVPGRHRSLRSVLDQSWYPLAEAEQGILKKLSIFRGGFEREAAEVVTGASLADLSGLFDKSLLQVGDSGRYQLYGAIHRYAVQKLRHTSDDYERARDLHSLFYLDFLRAQEAPLKGAHRERARGAIMAEMENVRAAWRWALKRGRWLEIKPAMLALWCLYEANGEVREGDDEFGRAVSGLRDYCAGLTAAAPAAARADGRRILGLALACHGWFQIRLGAFEGGKALLEESLSRLRPLAERAQPETAHAALFFGLGSLYFGGDPRTARDLLYESLALFEGLNDTWGTETASCGLEEVKVAVGQPREKSLDARRHDISRQPSEAQLLCWASDGIYLP
jgi:DNA-binding SARP family transcriptional activator